MRFVTFDQPGDSSVLYLADGPAPTAGPGQLLVRVRAAALNRADTLQREGVYVPPPDQSQILGIEIAGEVAALGAGTHTFAVGDPVMGVVPGGGYAEYCLIDEKAAVPIPKGLSMVEAAALPEAVYTAQETLFSLGNLKAGQTVLIHAGASGIGTMALQMARSVGARALFTTSTATKRQRCLELGGYEGILYPHEDFVARVQELTDGGGADLILDFVGADYLARNLEALAVGGTLLLVGVLSGWTCDLDMLPIIMRRLQIKGFSLRGQTEAAKAAIVANAREAWFSKLGAGEIGPVIHATFPIEKVVEAHQEIEANRNIGKILLTL